MAAGPDNAARASKPGTGRHVTTCPACQLTFRLSEAQLTEAGGLVRCGNCFKIFNSLDHLHGARRQGGDDDDFYIDDDFDLSLLERLSGGDSGDGSPAAHEEERDDESRSSALAAQLVLEKDTGDVPISATQADGDGDDIYIDDDFDLAELERLTGGPAGPTLSRIPENDLSGSKVTSPLSAAAAAAPSLPVRSADTPETSPERTSETLSEPLESPPEPLDLQPEQMSRSEQALQPRPASLSLSDLPDDLAADPLAPHLGTDKPRRRRPPWLTLTLLVILALPLGYGHHHAATLAQDPRLEPALATLCRITGCTLPAAVKDTGGVTTTQLVVRSHPDQRGLLRLDALLFNTATGARDLPELTLRFEDLQGLLIEERHFTPHQYLHGQQAAGRPLAAGEALRIRLDLLDPGPDAVSYTLTPTTNGVR